MSSNFKNPTGEELITRVQKSSIYSRFGWRYNTLRAIVRYYYLLLYCIIFTVLITKGWSVSGQQ